MYACCLGEQQLSFSKFKLFLIEAERCFFLRNWFKWNLNWQEKWTSDAIMILWAAVLQRKEGTVRHHISWCCRQGLATTLVISPLVHLDELLYLETTTSLCFWFTFNFVWWKWGKEQLQAVRQVLYGIISAFSKSKQCIIFYGRRHI